VSVKVGNEETWRHVQDVFNEIREKIETVRKLLRGSTLTEEQLKAIDFGLTRLRLHSEQLCEAIGDYLMEVVKGVGG